MYVLWFVIEVLTCLSLLSLYLSIVMWITLGWDWGTKLEIFAEMGQSMNEKYIKIGGKSMNKKIY
jgi:hypothetical protein